MKFTMIKNGILEKILFNNKKIRFNIFSFNI